MDLFANLATGFGAAVTPVNLGFCLFGCLIGTLIGVLPGIGPIATIAIRVGGRIGRAAKIETGPPGWKAVVGRKFLGLDVFELHGVGNDNGG